MARRSSRRRGSAAASSSSCSANGPLAACATRAAACAACLAAASAASAADDDDDDDDDNDDDVGDVANYHPAAALPPTDLKQSAAFTGLAAQPALRRPETRAAQGALNLDRMGNREAFLVQASGNAVPSACGLCAKRKGPWTECVVATGYLGGSCANCHYGAGGSKCSLRLPGKSKLFISCVSFSNLFSIALHYPLLLFRLFQTFSYFYSAKLIFEK
jgi:Protein of unknown function (DUF3716)